MRSLIGLSLVGILSVGVMIAEAEVFRGEIWTWDEKENTITIRSGASTFRVKVAPEEFIGLRLHEVTTVRGELAPPAELERVMTPAPSAYAVAPRGAVDRAEVTGKVVGIQSGIAAIDSPRGPLRVWVADGTSIQPGSPVRLRVAVQGVDIVQPTAGASPTPSPLPDASASVPSEPGDYAVVTGRVARTDPSGRITVESPRGPVEVWVSDAGRYRAGETVQVRTSLHPGQ